MAPRIWFITGAASGFGRCLTESVLSLGEIAVATDLYPTPLDSLKTKYTSSNLLILKCDVTKPDEIASAFALMKQIFGRCDVVYNNAGIAVFGEVETTPGDLSRTVMEVNFWGAVNVNREAVRFFREENPKGMGGTLMIVSSLAASIPLPCLGYYGASKAALSSVTEAMIQEISPEWNIRVTIIEPGAFATNIGVRAIQAPIHPAYAEPSMSTKIFRKQIENLSVVDAADPRKAAERIVEFVNALEGKDADLPMRWWLGKDAIAQLGPRMAGLRRELEKSESWSENLTVDSS